MLVAVGWDTGIIDCVGREDWVVVGITGVALSERVVLGIVIV